MNWPLATDIAGSIAEGFLASNADLMSVFTHLADPGDSHASRHRRGQWFAEAALLNLLPKVATIGQPPRTPPLVPVAVRTHPTARAAAAIAAQNPEPRIPAETAPFPQRRQYCQCGQCKWCLDNLRWDRVYNESTIKSDCT